MKLTQFTIFMFLILILSIVGTNYIHYFFPHTIYFLGTQEQEEFKLEIENDDSYMFSDNSTENIIKR